MTEKLTYDKRKRGDKWIVFVKETDQQISAHDKIDQANRKIALLTNIANGWKEEKK